MDFRQLNYFVAVAQTLSFSKAAQRLHISQPPLSQQIKLLEEHLNVQLFDRTRRSVALTHAGHLFYREAMAILERYAAAKQLCAWTLDGKVGKLRLAFTASVPLFEDFPKLIQGFTRCYPGIEIDLRHMSTGEQIVALNENEIDVGFLRPALNFRPPASIQTMPLWQDELMLVTARQEDEAARTEPVHIDSLADEGFILFPSALGCGLFEHISTLATAAGFVPRIVQQVRENSTTLALVAAGLGVSIVPSIYSKSSPPGVAFRQIAGARTRSCILMATMAESNLPSLQLFRSYCDQHYHLREPRGRTEPSGEALPANI